MHFTEILSSNLRSGLRGVRHGGRHGAHGSLAVLRHRAPALTAHVRPYPGPHTLLRDNVVRIYTAFQ